MMDVVDFEKKVERIYNLRVQKTKISLDIKKDVTLVLKYLGDINKKKYTTDKYSIEINQTKRNRVDIDAIKSAIEKGLLPETVLTTEKQVSLFIRSKDAIQLIGNKFVFKKRDY